MQRGILLAVEGIDGAGKTTQVALLAQLLRRAGEDVVTSKEPTSGPWGQKIKLSASNGRMSLEEELAAFIKDRTEHVAALIQPALDSGKIVILDRYFYSTIAYQGARGADREAIRAEMEKRFPVPDAVFILDIDPAVSLHRIASLRNEQPNQFEQIESLSKAQAIFNSLAGDNIVRVDGALPLRTIHEQIVDRFIEGPLRRRRDGGEWSEVAAKIRSLLPAIL